MSESTVSSSSNTMSIEDVDILKLDKQMRLYFKEEKEKLDFYKEEMNKLLNIYNDNNIRNHIKKKLRNDIDKLNNKIKWIDNDTKRNFYIIDTVDKVKSYKKILQTPIKISFSGENKETEKINKEKRKIKLQFLKEFKKYIESTDFEYELPLSSSSSLISLKSKNEEQIVCSNCNNKKQFETNDNEIVCLLCGVQITVFNNSTSYADSERVNITAKYTYDRKIHFRDCIKQYQGKQNCTIPKIIYDEITEEFRKHHLLSPNDSKQLRFRNINKQHIMLFLKELGYAKHYENCTLIHYNLTGIKPDDISHLENKLMDDFDRLVCIYDKIYKRGIETIIDRRNFINTQYVLYQLLLRHKHKCSKDSFSILKTIDRISFHDEVCMKLFGILGWNYTPYV